MDPTPFQERILNDEGLTTNLEEEDAIRLLRAISHRIGIIAEKGSSEQVVSQKVDALCRATSEIVRSGLTGEELIRQVSRIPV